MQKWHDRLAALVADTREQLRAIEPSRLVQRSGCAQDADGALRLPFFWEEYRVSLPDLAVRRADTGEEPSDFTQALILAYLVTADGTTPSGRWIAYRDLPDGMFYAQAFRGYAENRLVRALGFDASLRPELRPRGSAEREGGLEAFCQGAERLGGEPIEVGNAGYAFQVLPRVRLAAVYWLGDEDFPSQASILFEDTAPHYMSTDGLAVLGSHLVSVIVREAGRE